MDFVTKKVMHHVLYFGYICCYRFLDDTVFATIFSDPTVECYHFFLFHTRFYYYRSPFLNASFFTCKQEKTV
jgi:hypothetical protein